MLLDPTGQNRVMLHSCIRGASVSRQEQGTSCLTDAQVLANQVSAKQKPLASEIMRVGGSTDMSVYDWIFINVEEITVIARLFVVTQRNKARVEVGGGVIWFN